MRAHDYAYNYRYEGAHDYAYNYGYGERTSYDHFFKLFQCMLIAPQHINRRLGPQVLKMTTKGWDLMSRKILAVDHLT